jgi:hypothetical protein
VTLPELITELTTVAERSGNYAYQFRYRGEFPEFDPLPPSPLVQVLVFHDGSHRLVPCDRSGREWGAPLPEDLTRVERRKLTRRRSDRFRWFR